jgi:hypothetical protein
MRLAVPVLALVACLYGATHIASPVLSFVLFVFALGFVFDAATLLFARATGSGGMRDYRQ